MTIKKIEIHGLNPEHPISQVINEINDNLDAVINAINSIEGGKGVVGPTGPKGDKGDPGQQGDQGPAGKDGRDGIDGKNGADGKDGAPGIKGDKGDKGEQGLPGKDGANGANGKDGLPGTKGDKGDPGAKGEQGIQGIPGPAGKDGVTGPIGPAGPQGIGIKGFASGFVDAGQFVTLDNLKFTVTTGGQRGLSCATVSGTATLAISASYAMINGGYYGIATNWATMPTYNSTTPSGSWFGWSFPNAGDTSTYNIQDVNNQRFYRVTLMIGPGYTKNFISIERLY